VASSESFVAEAQTLADLVRGKGEAAVSERTKELDDLKILLKEKIELGEVVRFEAAAGNIMDSYMHVQGGRGVNVVVVEMKGATEELAHDIAVHIAFARPKYLTRDEVPADIVAAERATLETATRNEGKPEAAIGKIVDGKLNGFFKDLCLLEQPYAKDDKQSVKQIIGSASIVRFAQVEIG
jgi:elongation factor Ts